MQFRVYYRVNTYRLWWRGLDSGFPGGVSREFIQGGDTSAIIEAEDSDAARDKLVDQIQHIFPNTPSKEYEVEILDTRKEN